MISKIQYKYWMIFPYFQSEKMKELMIFYHNSNQNLNEDDDVIYLYRIFKIPIEGISDGEDDDIIYLGTKPGGVEQPPPTTSDKATQTPSSPNHWFTTEPNTVESHREYIVLPEKAILVNL